jgi:ABC-type branched-subunit amino acid transport system substrate-binding protein
MLPKKFEILARTLDTLITRRPRRLAHPIVAFTEETDGGLARATVVTYGKRLGETQVLGALVKDEPDDLMALLGDLTAGLSLQGRSKGRLRAGFPRLVTCWEALDAEQRTDRGELLEHLYRKFTRRHGFFEALEGVGNSPPPMLRTPVRLILQRPLLCWAYGEWTRRTRSLKWVSAGADQDFLTYISTREATRLDGLRERILVEAFLRDLEWQLRPPIFSVGRRRRRWHFVLVFPSVRRDGPAWRFIRDCARALAPRDEKKHRMRRTPVVMLAACRDGVPVPDALCNSVDAGENALQDAAEALKAAPMAGTPPVLRVPVTVADPDVQDFLDDVRFPIRRNRRADYLHPIGGVLVVTALIAAVTWYVMNRPPGSPPPEPGACADTWVLPATGETIGVTDGSCPLSSDPGLVGVERVIAAQNAQVDKMNRLGPTHHPYRTVVFLSPLTVPPSIPGHPGRVSLDELRGVALAQDDAFQAAQHDPTVVPIKVLLANTGDRFVAGPAVASKVVERARHDRTLAAIIGISQSRTESHQAIQVLSSLQLPIIGSTTTSDQILSSSPLYYVIVPRNAREAETLAQFLAHQPIAAGPGGEMVPAKKAVVIEDPKDEYSQNLAEDFRRSFTRGGNEVIANYDYGPFEDGTHDPGNIHDIVEGSADQLVQDLCTTIGDAPTFAFYASRAQLFPAVLDKIDQESECGGRELAIVGSDENARFIADHTIDVSRYPSVHFYDAAFSELDRHSTPVAQTFAKRYRKRYHESVGDSGAADAYDAFNAASKAIDQSYQQDPSIPHGVVASKMRDGLVHFNGVTGLITFNGEHETSRVPPDKPIFVVAERPEGPKALLACGRYADGAEWTTWGSGDFPCPHD